MHLVYRVFQPQGDGPRRHNATLLQGQVAMAGYHFCANAERLGLDPKTLNMLIGWPEGKIGECRFVIDAPASEETMWLALDSAVRLVGLGVERD